MDANANSLSRRRRIALGIVISVWVTITVSLFALPEPPFDLETWLLRRFPGRHADQYESVNRLIAFPLSAVLVSWFSASVCLIIVKRYMLLSMIVSGPVVAALMVAPTVDFRDPQWFTTGAVITIGCFVGLVVSGVSLLSLGKEQNTKHQ